MPGLLIKNVDPELHKGLKQRAWRNRRSLTKEALAILEAAVQADAARPTLAQLDRWRVRGRRALSDTIVQRGKRLGRP